MTWSIIKNIKVNGNIEWRDASKFVSDKQKGFFPTLSCVWCVTWQLSGCCCHSKAPSARPKQQPGPDWSIPPHQAKKWLDASYYKNVYLSLWNICNFEKTECWNIIFSCLIIASFNLTLSIFFKYLLNQKLGWRKVSFYESIWFRRMVLKLLAFSS